MNEFAVDLYTSVASVESGNVVVSPYSVTFTLSMIYAGAQGATATEMADVLHAADVPGWQEGINAYDLTLDARTVGSPTTWSAANKVWTEPGLALRDDYLDVLTGVYGSPLAEANFGTDADGARRVINGWVEDNTNDPGLASLGIMVMDWVSQGLLESGNGNSKLAREGNNHFGIKCTPDWTGGRTYHDDDKKDDCFRKYKNAEQSYEDHAKFLQRSRYAFLFELEPTDYKGWAKGLKKAGYATDPAYPQKLISLIERYHLNDQ